MAMYKNLDRVEAELIKLEMEVTEICLRGTGLVPATAKDYYRLNDIRKRIEDLTDGENTIHFNRRGQPEVMYRVTADSNEEMYLEGLADTLTVSSSSMTGEKHPFPAFLRNNNIRESFYIAKYPFSAVYSNATAHINYAVGLYGLPPAHSTGGFTVSYDGICSELDAINSATLPSHFPASMNDLVHKKQMPTWDEYGYIRIQMSRRAFEPYGNQSSGGDVRGNVGKPAPYKYNNYFPHTLNGTGPRTWRHNGKYTGISDLIGGLIEPSGGMFVKDGIIQLIDFTSVTVPLTKENISGNSSYLKAINTESGEYIAPSTVDGATIKAYCVDFESAPTNNKQPAIISDSITNRDGGFYGSVNATAVELKEGVNSNWKIETAGYLPFKSTPLTGRQYLRNADGETFIAGLFGAWTCGSYARGSCIYGYFGLSFYDIIRGGRSASSD